MASPQKENGFTSIANELFEVIIRADIPGRHKDVVFFVIRKTYGFNKKSDVISLSQFVFGTRTARTNICRILNDLKKKKVLLKVENKWSLNKDYEDWQVTHRSLPEGDLPSDLQDNPLVTYRSHTKETIQKKIIHSKNLMKKNSFKYNEAKSSDSYETEIDMDSGEEIKETKAPRAKNKLMEVIQWSEERRGSPFVNVPKQLKAISMAKEADISPTILKNRWIEMESNDFWKKTGFDWQNVINDLDKKI